MTNQVYYYPNCHPEVHRRNYCPSHQIISFTYLFIMNSKKLQILSALLLLISQLSFAHFGQRGPLGGTITCAHVYDSTVYFGTAEGGVFESTTSKLVAWRARPVGLHSGKITAITHTGKYLFTGTADKGVYRFTGYVGSDRYWEKVSTGLTNLEIKSLQSVDSITVLVGTNAGLFKTTNKGLSWSAVNDAAVNNKVITALAKAGNRIILTTQDGGVFISDDNGDSWQSFNDVNTTGVAGTNFLSYNATSDEILVLNNNGLFVAASVSTANTATFTAVTAPVNATIRGIANNGSEWLLATNKGVYTSATGSISFASQNNNLANLDVNAVVAFKTLYVAGTNHGFIYKTSNSSINWSAVKTGFNNLATYAMYTQGASFVIAATEQGVHVSKDFGTNYTILNKGLTDSLNVTDLEMLNGKLLASTKSGLFISSDTAKNWSDYSVTIGNIHVKKLVASGNFIYAITQSGQIYQSNLSNGWTLIQSGLPQNVNPTSLAFYEGKMLLGTYGNGTYTASETFAVWTAYGSGLSNLNVTAVATLVRAAGIKLFAGTDGGGVFVADEKIGSWTAAAPVSISHTTLINLDGTKIEAMATLGGYVFASYQGGLLTTKDFGQTWEAGGNQFNLPSYTHVKEIGFVTTRVYVTTDNNGLYSNGLSELEPLASISASQNLLCNATCNGSATVNAVAGAGNYTYLWSNNATTASVSGLCAGKYFVTVTSGAETSTDSIVITEPAVLNVALSATPSSGNNGTATATPTGGVSPYSYAWSNSETTAVIGSLVAGSYTVTVTDSNQCTVQKSVTVNSNVSVTELGSAQISLYPNPSLNGEVTLNLSAVKEQINSVTVYDYQGKELQVLNSVQSGNLQLNLGTSAGIYTVVVNTNSGTSVSKVLVK